MKDNKYKYAKVNDEAIDTWLEPYIGWTFEMHQYDQYTVWFYIDDRIENHDRELFDLINKKEK